MKKSHLLFLAFVLIGFNCLAQWIPQNSGTTNNLNSVYFTDADRGYAVGDGGIILKTFDGGTNWEMKNSGTVFNLLSVQFTDSLMGYVAGENSILLKTIDGGENWINQSISVSADLSSISFPATDTGYILGFFYDWQISDTLFTYIFKTNCGGNLWTISYLYKTIDDVGSPYLNSVFFPDVNTGYAVGVTGSMLYCPYLVKTIDGGVNWTSQTLGNFEIFGLSSAHFLNTDTGYVVGYGAYSSLKTINGGNDWTGLISDDYLTHNSVYFIDSEQGYLVGGESWSYGNIIKFTEDGGHVWATQYSDNLSGNYLLSVNFANDTTGYAVGSNGVILKTINGGITVGIDEDPQSINCNIYPNPVKDKINISSSTLTGISQLSIFNVSGEKVIERQLTDNETQIDISTLPGGVYFVRLQNEKMVEVGKIVKE